MSSTILTADIADCQACSTTSIATLERTRYFPRQLVGPDDLTQDQVYFREKQRRHNRLLHGWGIVCGAEVRHEQGCTAIVAPGYILGPYGDEILIDDEVSFDVCTRDAIGTFDCADPDPWCGDVPRVTEDTPLYLAVRYVERATRPVRVPGCGCGCDESECEYSRIRDGFELRVLMELPAEYRKKQVAEKDAFNDTHSCRGGGGRPCPPCPTEPWVVLCDFTVAGGEIASLTCETHRRYVASFAAYSFHCGK